MVAHAIVSSCPYLKAAGIGVRAGSDLGAAAWDAAANRGYFGAKDIAAMFDAGKPLDTWVADAFAKAEAKRPSAGPAKK